MWRKKAGKKIKGYVRVMAGDSKMDYEWKKKKKKKVSLKNLFISAVAAILILASIYLPWFIVFFLIHYNR